MSTTFLSAEVHKLSAIVNELTAAVANLTADNNCLRADNARLTAELDSCVELSRIRAAASEEGVFESVMPAEAAMDGVDVDNGVDLAGGVGGGGDVGSDVVAAGASNTADGDYERRYGRRRR